MNDKKKIILADERKNVASAGLAIKALMPSGNKLSDDQAMAVANYSMLTGLNPFRGETYGYQNRNGELVLVDGYKALIRWAKERSEYDDNYELLPVGLEGIVEGDIGYKCVLMRDDRKPKIKEYMGLGATFKEAYDLVAHSAVGIVTQSETKNAPPKGWSWDQVARKRALKACLNLAFNMPSLEELAAKSWEVDHVKTTPEDWEVSHPYQSDEELETHARMNAEERNRKSRVSQMTEGELAEYTEEIETANSLMRNNGDDDPLDLSPEPPPEPEDQTAAKEMDFPNTPQQLLVWLNNFGKTEESAGKIEGYYRDINAVVDSLEVVGIKSIPSKDDKERWREVFVRLTNHALAEIKKAYPDPGPEAEVHF